MDVGLLANVGLAEVLEEVEERQLEPLERRGRETRRRCVWGLGFRIQNSGFRIQDLGMRVWGLGFGVEGSWFRVEG